MIFAYVPFSIDAADDSDGLEVKCFLAARSAFLSLSQKLTSVAHAGFEL